MSGHRLLAVAGAALFGLLLSATPASASEPTIEWKNPQPLVTMAKDLVLDGTITGDSGNKIESVSFVLKPTGPAEPEGDPCRAVIAGETTVTPETPQDVPMEFKVPLKVPCNRRYEVSATITRPAPLGVCPHVGESCTTATTPLPFKVAIPPAQVTGVMATYDPASKEVGLTWKPNPEPDLRGYRVLRNPPGPAGFEAVGPPVTGTTFTDPGIDAPNRYQVIAVREGPDGAIEGKASTVVTAGPDTAQPATPPTLSSSAQRRAPGGGGGNQPKVRRRTATTVDTGFSRDLPFDPSQTTTTQVPTTSTEPEGQAAVLAEFDDDDDDPRGTLVPIAGGLALLMSAVHMRLLSKRVGEDDIPLLPGA